MARAWKLAPRLALSDSMLHLTPPARVRFRKSNPRQPRADHFALTVTHLLIDPCGGMIC